MRYFRIIAVVIIVVMATGYLYAQSRAAGLSGLSSGLTGGLSSGLNMGFAGCGSTIAHQASETKVPKLRAVLISNSRSGYQQTHGPLGLFNLGLISARMTKGICEDAKSNSPGCKALEGAAEVSQTLSQ